MHDFIIIGGGIVGMSTAMQLMQAYPEAKVLLLEKEAGLARHQTGHNSGVIHAGVYYTPGSLKARFCLEGNRATKVFCQKHAIPYDECGKLLVATSDLEMQRMQALWERTAANGIERHWLSAEALHEREPNIVGLGGIFVPSSGIVSYAQVTQAMSREFQAAGGEVRFNSEVTALQERADEVVVRTTAEEHRCRYLITCSGLMADRVVRMLGLRPDFIICPFRGEYYLLPEQHNPIVNHLIYPIPDPGMPFLGVHLTRMIDGTVTVGPNAVLAMKREGYRKTDLSLADMWQTFTHGGVLKVLARNLRPGLGEMKNSLFKDGYLKRVQKYCPSIGKQDLKPYPAGVRAQAVSRDGKLIDDFLFVNTPRTVNVCNAPSPAATSALPIGAYIIDKVREQIGDQPGPAFDSTHKQRAAL
ncbi:L-2-hydroxyglutarate oxidase [Pseudomonas sp. NyZ201]|uniref:L-2-hydroxyglutarate oxidase n=1 Tax=Pseudomonas sp. NyZ201 TaxID=3409857 RepID=UPI003CF7625A